MKNLKKIINIFNYKNIKYYLLILFIIILGFCGWYIYNLKNFETDKNIKKSIITIVFDDNDETIYSEAFARMKKLELPGTIYIITNFIDDNGKISKKQLQEMYDYGWTIGNHTKLHWNLLENRSDEEIKKLVKDARDEIIRNGWVKGADEFNPPQNKINDHILLILKPYIKTSTNDIKGLNDIPFNKFRISRYGASNDSPDEIIKTIDNAILKKQYIHLNFHKIGQGNVLSYPADDFQKIIEYIFKKQKEGQIEVKTMYDIDINNF